MKKLAGRPGLEPGYPESESGVLPIGRPPSRGGAATKTNRSECPMIGTATIHLY